jgi:signal transduction histidine kinase/ActR/RegA family two-component response regulator
MGDRLFYFPGTAAARLAEQLPKSYDRVPLGNSASESVGPGVLLVDATADQLERAAGLKARHHTLEIIALADSSTLPAVPAEQVFAYLVNNLPPPIMVKTLANAFAYLRLRQEQERTRTDLARLTTELQELYAIGIKLSAERDTDTLLELILTKAREITMSDAGSLYLVEQDPAGNPCLRFKLVQNDSIHIPFKDFTIPINSQSGAGHAAVTGQLLHMDDAYVLPPGTPYQIDRSFDQLAGYRTKSMLVVPLPTPTNEIIGVLELINCKADRARRFASPKEIERQALPFPARFRDLASSLASQAAVALENSRLYGELRSALDKLKASQERIVQTERLRALGEMAGGVAHDFNNVLAAILGRAQLLLKQDVEPEIRRQLRVIEQVATDGAQTVRRIQEFTRMWAARPFRPTNLNQIVEEVVEITRSRWKDEAHAMGIHYDVLVEASPLPPLAGDSSELRQALTNLVLNALDAMPEGGKVTLRTGMKGERLYCIVTDTGIGMPEEVRRRVFDPFFSTKAEKGTGLGLSVAYGIVNRHGGEIEVQSQEGRGSTFTIWLPPGQGLLEAPEQAPVPPPRRPLKILVIDDDQAVRDVLVELLAEQGHSVAAYANGQVGLRQLQVEPVDLVITDLGLPGLSGWEVAKLVKQESPETAVALITGWGDRIGPEEAMAKGVEFFIAKPFSLEDVQAVVERVFTPRDRGSGSRRTPKSGAAG